MPCEVRVLLEATKGITSPSKGVLTRGPPLGAPQKIPLGLRRAFVKAYKTENSSTMVREVRAINGLGGTGRG